MKKALVIGGGFAGCAATHQLMAAGGWSVTLVEAGPYLGAGVRTFWFGGHPYTFGPRHFLTQNEAVFRYLDALVPLRRCNEHEFLTYVERDNAFYSFPIHMDDIERMPDRDFIHQELAQVKGVANAKNLEEYWIGSVGRTLYEKYIENYNKKMWLVDDNRLIDTFNWSPKGVAIKEGPRAAWDTAISAYPHAPDGYNAYFDIATAGATVLLDTKIDSYDIPNKSVVLKGEKLHFDLIVSTISPDLLFEQCYGELGFIGRDLHKIVLPTEHVFPDDVYFLYYANDEKFTRLVEYKKFTRHQSPTTLIGMEIPSFNGRHYPLPYMSEIERARKYYELMPEGVYSIGRAGSYRYGLDIDDCIEQAMQMAQQVKEGGRDYPVPMEKWR
ncbi:FAD-dependent oxidoreductase [Azospirillum rugosum]|uniref:UDP-galactopyranose mutase n=1 Tax=Azospirillum rugosum TaxID=416170 RepID=A0ABS4SP11_9PROT|nr:FAD-dependent oxidoreductase [Azospirillum rugosum]MBP2294301.1 UDP-galactopyranose mutase [Azospirillum rugosum]MDQ0527636.1 UDP-galactopyranose mutase [Azospirillum rugosum]